MDFPYQVYFSLMATKSEKYRATTTVIAAIAATVFVYMYLKFKWGIECPLLEVTGYRCPLCGGTRSFLALLHGDIVAAYYYNRLFIVSLPLSVAYLGVKIKEFIKYATVRVSTNEFVIILGSLVAFGILRNVWR